MDAIDKELAEAEARVEFLKAVKLVRSSPEAIRLLKSSLSTESHDSTPKAVAVSHDTEPQSGTALERVTRWFRDRGNSPATVQQMSEAANVGASAIRQMIYRNQNSFMELGRDGREILYTLAESTGEA